MIESISGGEVIARVEEVQSSRGEPPYRVTVYQGLLKGDKMDTVVQKSVELGAELIIPVRCKNSVAKLDDEAAKKKIPRARCRVTLQLLWTATAGGLKSAVCRALRGMCQALKPLKQ